ncbi:MAG: hypothetical protein D6812_09535, partial [Deltaproteobacteria bacterium]
VFNAESDLILAESALASNLKLIETMLEVDPENVQLLSFASQGFSSYAFAFVEDAMEEAEIEGDETRAALHRKRARTHYARGKEYALRMIEIELPKVYDALSGSTEDLSHALARVEKKEEVESLFWLGYAWGQLINLSLDDMNVVSDVSKVELVMKRVLEVDPTYFNGGPHLFFGAYYASRAAAVGGDPEKGREHLEKVIALTQGKFLIPKYFLARFYAINTFDCPLFVRTLREIVEAPDDLWPEQRLANEVAKKRARRLLDNLDEYFDPETDCEGVEIEPVAQHAPVERSPIAAVGSLQ